MHIFESQGMFCQINPRKPIRIFRVLSSAPRGLFAHRTANLVGKTKQCFLVSRINWQVWTCFMFTSSYFFRSEWPVSFLEHEMSIFFYWSLRDLHTKDTSGSHIVCAPSSRPRSDPLLYLLCWFLKRRTQPLRKELQTRAGPRAVTT